MDAVIQPSCLQCGDRADRALCDLPSDALRDFDGLKSVVEYPRGTALFREGHAARDIFVLCSGRAKLSLTSEAGRRLTLRVAGPGEILGLSAALAGSAHEVTAELVENAQVAVIKRKDLLQFLRMHRDACLHVVGLLSQDLHIAYDRVRAVGLGRGRRSRVPARVH
jgi:CRP/FNR family cyclic AMP-dependent transcriptional regulator